MGRKVVLVTGASRGLGIGIVRQLLLSEADVFALARTPIDHCPEVLALQSQYGKARLVYESFDLTKEGSCLSAIQSCISHFGKLNGLVHNAGVLEPLSKLESVSIPAWRHLMEVNVFSGVELIQHALPHLRSAEEKGRIVIVSSGASAKATAGWVPYCVSKSAVNMIVQGLGIEEPNVISVAIRPGVVDTDMQGVIRNQGQQAMESNMHDYFMKLHEEGKLLSIDQPGSAIAKCVLSADSSLSGSYVNWDSI